MRREPRATTTGADLSALADIVGAAHVTAGSDADAVCGVVPRQVVRPGEVAEVQAVVRAVAAAGESLAACGRGAHLELGAPPARVDVLLRLDRLARVIDHQAADMTVTVEAGCSLESLSSTLATTGQWLPIDPPRPGDTTVGGLVAANLSGPLRASQGTARDLMIGLRTVGADGAIVCGGGKVVKNVAGYDLPKLHVGAFGTVGILVEVTWKVRPKPACEAAVVIACASAEAAGDTALALRDLVEPAWLEAAGMRALADGVGDGAAVAVGLMGVSEEVAAAHAKVMEWAARAGQRAVGVNDGAALRFRLAEFAVDPAAAVLRCGTLPTDVGAVMALAERTARDAGGAARCLAHAANGVVRVAVEREGAIVPVLDALRAHVAGLGGNVVVERIAAGLRSGVDTWGPLSGDAALARGIRAAFDPAGVFASGRGPGGL